MDGDGLRGLGAMEDNVDKLVANRMKKRGMSWTISGAQGMARLISLREMGELHSWINREDKLGGNQPPKKKTVKEKPMRRSDPTAWFKVSLPALYGPQQSRPWVQIPRALAHGVSEA